MLVAISAQEPKSNGGAYTEGRAAQLAGVDGRRGWGKEGKSGGRVESRREGIYTPRKQ